MAAFIAVWTGVIALIFAIVNLTVVSFEWRFLVMLIWGIVDALPLTFGLLVLWSLRKADAIDTGVSEQRVQAKAGVAFAVVALGLNCGYLLWYYQTHVLAAT